MKKKKADLLIPVETEYDISLRTTRIGYWMAIIVMIVLTTLIQAYFNSRTANPVLFRALELDPGKAEYEQQKAELQLMQIKRGDLKVMLPEIGDAYDKRLK
jgi:hypothetical protein